MTRILKRKSSKGMSGHQRAYRGKSDDWLTPPRILEALGKFDLDPCCPQKMPWRTATKMIHQPADGLAADWQGRVWLNPPYGPEAAKWLTKLADHGHGTALIFARTETDCWFEQVWYRATAVLFLRGRLHFHNVKGERAPFNSGAPSALVAYGNKGDAEQLYDAAIPGLFLWLDPKGKRPTVS